MQTNCNDCMELRFDFKLNDIVAYKSYNVENHR